MNTILHWLYMFFGLDNASGAHYLFWSGIGSDITELAILGGLVQLYRQHKCHSCHRIAHHPVEGTPYRTCHKHTTEADHALLNQHHARKHPAQHKFLNK